MQLQNVPPSDVELCMGSSCYCRGNRALAAELKTEIERNGWENRVNLRGALCCNGCATGPHVVVDGKECGGKGAAAIVQMIAERAVPCNDNVEQS